VSAQQPPGARDGLARSASLYLSCLKRNSAAFGAGHFSVGRS
jgi:hypothetical protein